jgi:hypothetical protein
LDQEAVNVRPLSPPESTPPPGTLQVLQQDMQRAIGWLQDMLEALTDWTFDITQQGAYRRRTFLIALIIVIWTGWSLLSYPVRWGVWRTEPLSLLIDLGAAFFGAASLRKVIVFFLGYWLAFRVAALYLDDVFELKDLSVAEGYIRQGAFASGYDLISIKEGAISPESRNSPIYRIGGPGSVQVHLENVALFEKIGGQPHIIGSAAGIATLDSFERLRQVIDLRDQVLDMTVTGRTRDGIRVTAKDVRLIFSVDRGFQQSDGRSPLAQPYAFTEDAIKNLVYNHNSGPWTLAMRSLIRGNLLRFIAQHTLSEFLASVNPREAIDLLNAPSGPLDLRRAAAPRGLTAAPAAGGGPEDDFIPRDQITNLFYNFTNGFHQDANDLGVALQWIGLGTWVTPSEIIPDQHLEAWQISLHNQIIGNEMALQDVQREGRTKELLRLIREIPETAYVLQEAKTVAGEQINRELILTYRERLRNAWEIYQNSTRPPQPELEAALKHLSRLTARWLN